MREIKFRAWSEETNEMVKVAHLDLTGETIYFENGIKSLNIGQELSFWNQPFILMQYTGLKDKNGVEIYEGDIVKYQNRLIGYVTYLIQEAGFVVVLKKSDYRLGHRNTNENYELANCHEVIGNIYENPELLEVTE